MRAGDRISAPPFADPDPGIEHEKRTNKKGGHEDIIGVIGGLRRSRGEEGWKFIRERFDVGRAASYYAVNMCISNWDGFFNNYLAYHDVLGTGKWELIPWDEDKTWGDFDGAPPERNFYDMPLTMGMDGDRPGGGGGIFGGAGWWRPPGYFSGPLLANPRFRALFLARLKEICGTVFTEEKFRPAIDEMERRLEPEIAIRARITGADPEELMREFRRDMKSFRDQLVHRREFILSRPEIRNVAPVPAGEEEPAGKEGAAGKKKRAGEKKTAGQPTGRTTAMRRSPRFEGASWTPTTAPAAFDMPDAGRLRAASTIDSDG